MMSGTGTRILAACCARILPPSIADLPSHYVGHPASASSQCVGNLHGQISISDF
jgi:hypothetical protein